MTRLTAVDRWHLLSASLMGPRPGLFFEALRARVTLKCLLPELDALFGAPQTGDGPEPVDVGVHQLRLVDMTARALAPLEVRFAALMHKIGKAGMPRAMLPSHLGHEERGLVLSRDASGSARAVRGSDRRGPPRSRSLRNCQCKGTCACVAYPAASVNSLSPPQARERGLPL